MKRGVDIKVCYEDPEGNVTVCGDPKMVLRLSVRKAMMAEIQAVNHYEALAYIARLINESKLADLFLDIANEEKRHLGEFMKAFESLEVLGYEPDEKYVEEGKREAAQKLR